jgi:hypothetical protein
LEAHGLDRQNRHFVLVPESTVIGAQTGQLERRTTAAFCLIVIFIECSNVGLLRTTQVASAASGTGQDVDSSGSFPQILKLLSANSAPVRADAAEKLRVLRVPRALEPL